MAETINGWLYKVNGGYLYKVKKVRTSSIKAGDTVLCSDGEHRTVSAGNLGYCRFMGASVFGSAYPWIKKVIIGRSTPDGIVESF